MHTYSHKVTESNIKNATGTNKKFCFVNQIINFAHKNWGIFNKNAPSIFPRISKSDSNNGIITLTEDDVIFIDDHHGTLHMFMPFSEEFPLYGSYPGSVRVSGDGACYFRAVISSLLISILYKNDEDIQTRKGWIEYLMRLFYGNPIIRTFLSRLINNNKIIPYIEFMKEYVLVDYFLIRECKTLLIDFARTNEFGQFSIGDNVFFHDENQVTLTEYLNNVIRPFNMNMQGPFLEPGILPYILGCRSSKIFTLTCKKPSKDIHVMEISSGNMHTRSDLPEIYLLNPQGHFDVLIPNNFRPLNLGENNNNVVNLGKILSNVSKNNPRPPIKPPRPPSTTPSLSSSFNQNKSAPENIYKRMLEAGINLNRVKYRMKTNGISESEIQKFVNNNPPSSSRRPLLRPPPPSTPPPPPPPASPAQSSSTPRPPPPPTKPPKPLIVSKINQNESKKIPPIVSKNNQNEGNQFQTNLQFHIGEISKLGKVLRQKYITEKIKNSNMQKNLRDEFKS